MTDRKNRLDKLRFKEFTSHNGDILNPLLNPGGGGLVEKGDLFERGVLLNLEKTMLSVLHKE